jgi:hypothetical protein
MINLKGKDDIPRKNYKFFMRSSKNGSIMTENGQKPKPVIIEEITNFKNLMICIKEVKRLRAKLLTNPQNRELKKSLLNYRIRLNQYLVYFTDQFNPLFTQPET